QARNDAASQLASVNAEIASLIAEIRLLLSGGGRLPTILPMAPNLPVIDPNPDPDPGQLAELQAELSADRSTAANLRNQIASLDSQIAAVSQQQTSNGATAQQLLADAQALD